MKKEYVEKLAEEHWKYVESVLKLHKVPDDEIERTGVHYQKSMIHGFKHGYEFASNPMTRLWDNPEDEKWDDISFKKSHEDIFTCEKCGKKGHGIGIFSYSSGYCDDCYIKYISPSRSEK